MDAILRPCPRCKGLCHIEIVETIQQKPNNIRIGCTMHSVWLPESFATVDEALEAWNKESNNGIVFDKHKEARKMFATAVFTRNS